MPRLHPNVATCLEKRHMPDVVPDDEDTHQETNDQEHEHEH